MSMTLVNGHIIYIVSRVKNGPIEIFLNIHCSHFSLLIVSYHHEILRKTSGVNSENEKLLLTGKILYSRK